MHAHACVWCWRVGLLLARQYLIFKKYLSILCVTVLSYMYICAPFLYWCLQRSVENTGFHEPGFTDDYACWKSNLGLLQEPQGPLSIESSIQPTAVGSMCNVPGPLEGRLYTFFFLSLCVVYVCSLYVCVTAECLCLLFSTFLSERWSRTRPGTHWLG